MRTQNLSLKEPFFRQRAFLSSISERGLNQEVEIGDDINVGRSLNNELVLDDPYVSLKHSRINRRLQSFILSDLGSLNGTYVNGTKIHEATLSENDRIQFGNSAFIFSYDRDQREALFLETSLEKNWNTELQRLPNMARSDFSVLITGPTGSGKERIARKIHERSRRSLGPFFSLNCSAFQESLIESELFGHEKGSFTGALYQRKGAFESAKGGSLFLDEIGDLPFPMQAKLLRVLENSEFKPLGSDKFFKTDVRILAATHHDLEEKVSQGEFREDLFYRLNILMMRVPSLQERKKDFESILYFFARKMRVRFSVQAVLALKDYDWPGNIRELKNFVSKCSAYFSPSVVTDLDVYKVLSSSMCYSKDRLSKAPSYSSVVQNLEKGLIEKALFQNKGNQSRSAEMLNMPRSTLNDKIKTYKIKIENFKKRK